MDDLTEADERAERAEAEVERLRRRVEHLQERNTELQDLELGIKSLTTGSGSVDMSLHMAHDMMRILVAGFVTILDAEGGPNYAEMSFKLRDTTDRYTLVIRRPDGKTPGEVASEQRQRAEQAEDLLRVAHDTSNRSEAERARAVHRAEQAEAEVERLRKELDYLASDARLVAAEAATERVSAAIAERRTEVAEFEAEHEPLAWSDAVTVTCARIEDALRPLPDPIAIRMPALDPDTTGETETPDA